MHQIRYFLAVCRTLNFTRAAESCHVAQPSLTRAIKLLEAELGGDLFRRERNLTHLTDFGQRMLPLLRQCYDSAAAAKTLATSMRTGVSATLALGLSHTVSMALLVEPLAELTRVFPGLDLRFVRGTAPELAESLKKGDVALAIAGPLGETWERLDRWPLFDDAFRVVVGPGHRLAGSPSARLEDLAAERLLARSYCESMADLDACLRDREIDWARRHEVVSDPDLLQLVRAGLGIAILPESAAPRDLDPVPIDGLDLRRSVALYGVAGRERSPPATALLKLLRARDWETALAAA
ncbi:LysR family transcriptional regulator [Prosthecomicrobium sp. N25]|uniref:LysR family transcriptional regulator n=1 Tax=Prosthecomicrobium sp. N25 TaxID=3129254 RepID=UPI003077437C